mmetsp:Transcript_115171/g.229403  ORF Transcript_115171/g.229403 Transcript_115171/m.229403 type:complete len:475 (+) Transcript_115171:81-1505(+)
MGAASCCCSDAGKHQDAIYAHGLASIGEAGRISGSPEQEEACYLNTGVVPGAVMPGPMSQSKVLSPIARDPPTIDIFERLFTRKPSERQYTSVGDALAHCYAEKLLPVELSSDFHKMHLPELPPAHFSARPMVLTMGQYSTGKSTFIKHIIDCDYPGLQIGPEPTTDKFIVVCHGSRPEAIPGNALVYDPNYAFTPLSAFGNSFLGKFMCARVCSPVLEGVTFVDTPGVLSGEKQRLKRGYEFEEVMGWFIEHSAMIILFFDAHKLDLSDEFKRCLIGLNSCIQKVHIILNKADRMTTQQLVRVHGALMWALGKVIETPEVAKIYVGSFWDEPLQEHDLEELFEAERSSLYAHIERLPCASTVLKLNDLSRRARMAKAHALVLDHLRNEMPAVWGQAEKQAELLKALPSIYVKVSRQHGVSLGDFPDVETMRSRLACWDFMRFERVQKASFDKLDSLLAKDIPAILKMIPEEVN